MSFKKDLEKGKEAEREIQKWFGGDLSEGRCSTHDLSIEVKHDMKAIETGNVAFEVECNGKPSGVKATESEWWIVKISDPEVRKHVYYIRHVTGLVDWLRRLHHEKKARVVKGGDGWRVKMVLVPIQEFILEFRQLFLNLGEYGETCKGPDKCDKRYKDSGF